MRRTISRLNIYLRWALAPLMLVATPAFASTAVLACFGSGTITTNPLAGCPSPTGGKDSKATPLFAVSMGASVPITLLKSGGVTASRPSFSSVVLEQRQSAASDSLLHDLFVGKSVGPVVVALYEGGSTTPSFTILLTGTYVESWQVSGAEGGGGLVESVSLLFTTISILDVATNQTVSWDVATNSP